ncbi:TlpA disulfide reductase family protein [Stigmatella sp. ncwal1]|uniref:TlpA disulfide reductase family protein n=1 Tax=Stigmatella ashevillensis TaxID=2995309 RepID=A0ABT5DHQ1_9BACT|nr:TlpA disulfide reductase family protein [Stigmatella ashevillena]MDC0713186.1 TlpA disulfide reductase family protein [Stigmatella ashevillena]
MSMPKIPLKLLDPEGGWVNAPVHVSELDGQPILLHFWSMNCRDCAAQFAEVKHWIDEYGPRGLRIIGVDVTNSDEELSNTNAVEAFARQHELSCPIAVDDGSMAKVYRVTKHPSFLLFNADGWLRHHLSGPDAMPKVRSLLAGLMQTGASAEASPAP